MEVQSSHLQRFTLTFHHLWRSAAAALLVSCSTAYYSGIVCTGRFCDLSYTGALPLVPELQCSRAGIEVLLYGMSTVAFFWTQSMQYQHMAAVYQLKCIPNFTCAWMSVIYKQLINAFCLHTESWSPKVHTTSPVYSQGSLPLACPRNASCFAEGALQSATRGRPCSLAKVQTNKRRPQVYSLDVQEKHFRTHIKKIGKPDLCKTKRLQVNNIAVLLEMFSCRLTCISLGGKLPPLVEIPLIQPLILLDVISVLFCHML